MPRRTLLALALLGAAPCAAAAQPLDFESFFKGRLTGTGSVDNYRDGTHRPFTATIEASWSGPRGTVTENLAYADGEKKRFAWTFERTAPGRWTGRRDDLVSDADIVLQGDVLRMTYTAKTRLPSGKVWQLSFDDRFEQTGPGAVTVRGAVSYLFVGVGVTEMTLVRSGR